MRRRYRASANEATGLFRRPRQRERPGRLQQGVFAQNATDDQRRRTCAGGFNKTHSLSGAAPPNRVVIIRFDSGMSAVNAWYEK